MDDSQQSADVTQKSRASIRSKNARPTMQFYRPPGLRGTTNVNNNNPTKNLASVQINSDQTSNASSTSSRSSVGDMQAYTSRRAQSKIDTQSKMTLKTLEKCLNKIDVNAPNKTNLIPLTKDERQESCISQSDSSVPSTAMSIDKVRVTSRTKEKKKNFMRQDAEEIGRAFEALGLGEAESVIIKEFITGEMTDDTLAFRVGNIIAHHVIEQRKQSAKIMARACALMLNAATPTGSAFYAGLLEILTSYYDERATLRRERPRVWIGLLTFSCELCAAVGSSFDGSLMHIIFGAFDYMLKSETLDSLKIEELECMMSALLSVGYELERNCPDQLGAVQNSLRDAFMNARESWTRRMLLLMIELGASGWQLSQDANEYYFQ